MKFKDLFWDDYLEMLSAFSIILIIIICLTLIVFGAIKLDIYKCNKLGNNIGIETKYEFLGGACLLNINNQWTPKERWINNSGN